MVLVVGNLALVTLVNLALVDHLAMVPLGHLALVVVLGLVVEAIALGHPLL